MANPSTLSYIFSKLAKYGAQAQLPAINKPGFNRAHAFFNQGTGRMNINRGNASLSLYSDDWSNRNVLEDRFFHKPGIAGDTTFSGAGTYTDAILQAAIIANRNWIVTGTGGTSALCTFAAGGGITLTTDGTSGHQEAIIPSTVTNISEFANTTWKTQYSLAFEAVVQAPATITSMAAYAGVKVSAIYTKATDADQAYFVFSTAAGYSATNWCAVSNPTSGAGNQVLVDTGVAFTAGASYFLQIWIDNNLVPHFFINGVEVAVGQAAVTTNKALIPVAGVQTITASARALTIRRIHVSQNYY